MGRLAIIEEDRSEAAKKPAQEPDNKRKNNASDESGYFEGGRSRDDSIEIVYVKEKPKTLDAAGVSTKSTNGASNDKGKKTMATFFSYSSVKSRENASPVCTKFRGG